MLLDSENKATVDFINKWTMGGSIDGIYLFSITTK